jgi:hypothetical protein
VLFIVKISKGVSGKQHFSTVISFNRQKHLGIESMKINDYLESLPTKKTLSEVKIKILARLWGDDRHEFPKPWVSSAELLELNGQNTLTAEPENDTIMEESANYYLDDKAKGG